MASLAEENYLKAIYHHSLVGGKGVTTNQLAEALNTKPASVTDMIQKLAEKKLVNYTKYQGVGLTQAGKKLAVSVIRKHRLWEAFLVQKLNFKWDEVHEMAEQLEHIESEDLVNRLEKYLGYPSYDPHGDPIPDKNGNISSHKNFTLKDVKKGETGVMLGVKDHTSNFLQFLDQLGIGLGSKLKVIEDHEYDGSKEIMFSKKKMILSGNVVSNIYVKKDE